jgi:hypothetical protein
MELRHFIPSLAPAEQAMTNQALAGLGATRTPADEVALSSLNDTWGLIGTVRSTISES